MIVPYCGCSVEPALQLHLHRSTQYGMIFLGFNYSLMLLADLLSSDGYIPVNKHLGRTIGTNEAILLGELIRQRERFGNDEFYITQPILSHETTLSVDQIKSCGGKLKELGLVGIVRKGSPGKNFYTIDDIKVFSLFQIVENPLTSKRKIHGQDSGKSTNIYILNKKYNKKDNKGRMLFFNDEIVNDLFHEFLEDRKERKKKPTDRAIDRLVTKLNKITADPFIQSEIINISIECGYTTFYKLKPDYANTSGSNAGKKEPSNAFHNNEGGADNKAFLASQGYDAKVISDGGQ